MFEDVEEKVKMNNQLFFSHSSESLQELIKLMKAQKHRTIVMWAFDCAKETLKQFEEKYPHEKRPRNCLELCEDWSKGKIKMPIAKKAILDSHAVAKEIEDKEYGALCHAIGHAGATVHVETHGIGLPIYELTSIVLKFGKENYQEHIKEKIKYYYDRLMFWNENIDKINYNWVGFLLKDNLKHNDKTKASE